MPSILATGESPPEKKEAAGDQPAALNGSDDIELPDILTCDEFVKRFTSAMVTARELNDRSVAEGDDTEKISVAFEREDDGSQWVNEDWESPYIKGVLDRAESNMSVCHDGDMTFAGQSFVPIWEAEDEPNEMDWEYLGGHTFRNHGITQLIRATSEATAIPESLCTILALTTFSAAIGRGLQISFKPDEFTSLGLFCIPLSRSGSGKTQAAKHLAKPLIDLHNERQKHWKKNLQPKLLAKKEYLESSVKRFQKE
jgi:hypothetical protein